MIKENNITGFVLFDLTHKDLKEMGIYDLGERAKILIELKKFYYVILNSKDVSIYKFNKFSIFFLIFF